MTEYLRQFALREAILATDCEGTDADGLVKVAEKFLAFLDPDSGKDVAAEETAAPEFKPGDLVTGLGYEVPVRYTGYFVEVDDEGDTEIKVAGDSYWLSTPTVRLAEPRVFASADEIPADVKRVRMATGEEVVRVEHGTGWSYLEPDGTPVVTTGDHWDTFQPDELPVTEVLDD